MIKYKLFGWDRDFLSDYIRDAFEKHYVFEFPIIADEVESIRPPNSPCVKFWVKKKCRNKMGKVKYLRKYYKEFYLNDFTHETI